MKSHNIRSLLQNNKMGEQVRVRTKCDWPRVGNCWAGWGVHGGSLYFSLHLWICLRISTIKRLNITSQLCQQFAILQSTSIHSSPIIHSCGNPSPLNLALLFPTLFSKGILCHGVREVTAGVFAGRLHWVSSDDTTLLPMSWHAGYATVWWSQAQTLQPDSLGLTPASATYQLCSLNKPLNLSVTQLHHPRSRTMIVPSSSV